MKQSVIALLLLLSSLTFSQEQKPTIHITELPPEPFPFGTCRNSESGYLGVSKGNREITKLTDKQLGEYVRVRLSQGYSVALYPQLSGKIFAIATCESQQASAAQPP